jgi:hypothetical protein
VYRVLSEEAEEFRGYHCLGRSLQDPVLIRWSSSCATIAPSARDLRGAQSEQAMDSRGLIGHKTVLKHVSEHFFDANSPFAGL